MRIKDRISEWFSVQLVKNPRRMVLLAILLFNLVFLAVSAFIISRLSLSGTESMSFLEAAYYTVTMILDAGCIQFVIADIGTAGVAIGLPRKMLLFLGITAIANTLCRGLLRSRMNGREQTANQSFRLS